MILVDHMHVDELPACILMTMNGQRVGSGLQALAASPFSGTMM